MDCIAHQAPLSMGLSRQESWSGCHCPQTFLVLQAFLGTPSNCPSHFSVTVSQVAAGFSLLFFPSTIFQGAANPDGYHLSKHKAHPSGTLYPAWICNQIHGGPMDSVSYQIQCCKSYLVLQKKKTKTRHLPGVVLATHLMRLASWYHYRWNITDYGVLFWDYLFKICDILILNRNTDCLSRSPLLQLSVMWLLLATMHWVIPMGQALETGHWDTVWRRPTTTLRSGYFHYHFCYRRGIRDA